VEEEVGGKRVLVFKAKGGKEGGRERGKEGEAPLPLKVGGGREGGRKGGGSSFSVAP